jgi:hypothetical protein
MGVAVTFKSGIPWPVQLENLPTYEGNRPGRNEVRKAEMEAGGMGGTRRVDWTDAQGTEYILNTRKGFPEIVSKRKAQASVPDPDVAKRGWVAHNPGSADAALFSPYTLVVAEPKYKVFNTTYSVLPFSTPYNVPSGDSTNWRDVLTFHNGTVKVNGIEYPTLSDAGAPRWAIPWLIPHTGTGVDKYGDAITNAYEKRVFAVGRDSVTILGRSAVSAVLNNPSARPSKAIVCGARIEASTHQSWLSQFAFTGATWDAYTGGWAYTSAHVSMLIASPYLTKVDAGSASEQTVCMPVGPTSTTGTFEEAIPLPNAQIGLVGYCVLGSATATVRNMNIPATAALEHFVAGKEVGSFSATTYSGTSSGSVAICDKTATFSCSNSFVKRRHLGQVKTEFQSFAIAEPPAPSYGNIDCYYDGSTSPATLDHGIRGSGTISVGQWTYTSPADHWIENADVAFNVSLGSVTLVGGTASRHKGYGDKHNISKVNWAPARISAGAQWFPWTVTAASYGDYRDALAVAVRNSVATSFVGQTAIWSDSQYAYFNPVYSVTVTSDRHQDDQSLIWTTKDYILFDEANACYVSIDSAFNGSQSYGQNGVATLAVRLSISTPAGAVSQIIFSTTINYAELLPEQTLDSAYAYIPSPQQRVIFAPLFQEQGDFKGAVYTTSGEVSGGAAAAYLFNFVLTLDTYADIGTDTTGNETINFIPCNLLEMLYAYVYSSKYGVDPTNRYPVDNVTVFNAFQSSLFAGQWRVNYKDGAIDDWLDNLGVPYVSPTTTELSRT